jgi:hypothetical protein
LAAKSLEFADNQDDKPVKLFFQDEGRFGRIDNISSCWVPPKSRAKVGSQIIREYTYTYFAGCPETGENISLILPYANEECMALFLEECSKKFSGYRVIMAMDRASWHTGDKAKKWQNIVPLFQPAHSPEVNPAECIWKHIRTYYGFKNQTFTSMKEVEDRLVEALSDLELDKETVKSIMGFNWILDAI